MSQEPTFASFLTSIGYTTCGFARKTGLTPIQVSEYRRGIHLPTRRTAARIAAALGLTLAEIEGQFPIAAPVKQPCKQVFCRTCQRSIPRTRIAATPAKV